MDSLKSEQNESMQTIFAIRHLNLYYGKKQALHDINVDLYEHC